MLIRFSGVRKVKRRRFPEPSRLCDPKEKLLGLLRSPIRAPRSQTDGWLLCSAEFWGMGGQTFGRDQTVKGLSAWRSESLGGTGQKKGLRKMGGESREERTGQAGFTQHR